MNRSILRCALAVIVHVTFSLGVQADEFDFFEQRIRPILVEHCYECHSGDAKKIRGGLLLDSRAGIRRGGKSGPGVVPGNANASLILTAIRHDSLAMPPRHKLPTSIARDFEKWIRGGAPDPRETAPSNPKTTATSAAASDFWAFQPLMKVVSPMVQHTNWASNIIDQFVLAGLESNALGPNQDASRRELIRRLTFDLTGLPPTPEEMTGFLADTSDTAWTTLVDRLLASPQFGEHWARHWLDVVRYADSNGGDINLTFHNAWRFRDYVIKSLNGDKPFDQFIREHVAGDLLPFNSDDVRAEQLIASGFLIIGPKMLSERAKEKLTMDVVDEQLDTIGRAFLGLTLGCARCHDHKFDPIPTREYYALAGILRSTVTVQGIRMNNVNVSGWIERPLPIKPAHANAIAMYEAELKKLTNDLATAKKTGDKLSSKTVVAAKDLPGIVVDDSEAIVRGTWTSSTHVSRFVQDGYIHDNRESKGQKSVRYVPVIPAGGTYEVRLSYTGGDGKEKKAPITVAHAKGTTRVLVDQSQIPPVNGLFQVVGRFTFEQGKSGSVTISTDGTKDYVIADAVQFLPVEEIASIRSREELTTAGENTLKRITKRVRDLEQQINSLKKNSPPPVPLAMAAEDIDEPGDCEIRIRGEAHNTGDTVPRGFLSALEPESVVTASHMSGRLELAQWLASRENALTARVISNRIWHHLFGTGIVASVDNFGLQGDRPSHPELLDYLATRLIGNNWSLKDLIREVVLSHTYRQSSVFDVKAMSVDPANRLLWRHDRRRLTGEAFRDAVLKVSGMLDSHFGGSSVSHLGEQAVANNLKDKTGVVAIDQNPRRSIYLPIVRNDIPDILNLFNFADPDVVMGNRSSTTVPAQSLFLMNSTFMRQQSERVAKRILNDSSLPPEVRLDLLTELALGRQFTPLERRQSLEFLGTISVPDGSNGEQNKLASWTRLAHAILASTEFRFVE